MLQQRLQRVGPEAYLYLAAGAEQGEVRTALPARPWLPGGDSTGFSRRSLNGPVQTIHDRAKQENLFFLYFSLTSPHESVVPSERFRGESGIAPMTDFVMETDWAAGQVIEAIDSAGIADDTIVLFTADNGHSV